MKASILRAARAAVLVVVVPAAGALAGCTSQAICAKEAECRDDPPGDDFLRICSIRHEGNIRALRANKEEVCHRLADASLALDACRAQLDCDDYNERDLGQKCEDEIDEFNDAFDDADGDCSSLD